MKLVLLFFTIIGLCLASQAETTSTNYGQLAPPPPIYIPNITRVSNIPSDTQIRTTKKPTSLAKYKYRSSISCQNPRDTAQCLICNCYHEARGEYGKTRDPLAGLKAILNVSFNRANSKYRYKSTTKRAQGTAGPVCGVIYAYKQFSWTKRSVRKPAVGTGYRNCLKATEASFKTPHSERSKYGLHYHANYVRPKWARNCPVSKRIGTHIFYNDCDLKCRSNYQTCSSNARITNKIKREGFVKMFLKKQKLNCSFNSKTIMGS